MTAQRYEFLHAADLHIDSPLRGLQRYEGAPAGKIRAAPRRAFERLVRFAIEHEVAFVILAGDVFDGDWEDYNTGLWFAAQLRDLTRCGIRVYLLAGNHDAEGEMTRKLPYSDGVKVFESGTPETFVDEATGAVLHGQSFATRAVTEDLAAGYPAPVRGAVNIGVLHTALDGREGHGHYAPCSPNSLRAKGYDYWALGHVHQREVISEEPWIVFPGNLQARHIRETGPKGATLVTVEDGRIATVEPQPLDVARFARVPVDVSDCTDLADCRVAVEAAIQTARSGAEGRLLAVRIELTGASPAYDALHREEYAFVAVCRNLANAVGKVWVEKVKVGTRPAVQGSGRDVVETLDLESDDLLESAREAARGELDALLGKLGELSRHAGLFDDAANLHDDEALRALMDEARDEVMTRIMSEDAATRAQRDA